jgi:hypothetical protein
MSSAEEKVENISKLVSAFIVLKELIARLGDSITEYEIYKYPDFINFDNAIELEAVVKDVKETITKINDNHSYNDDKEQDEMIFAQYLKKNKKWKAEVKKVKNGRSNKRSK